MLLVLTLADKAEELAAASRRWDGLVKKRTAFDAKVAAARAKAQAAVEVGQQRKAAKTAASDEFARQFPRARIGAGDGGGGGGHRVLSLIHI